MATLGVTAPILTDAEIAAWHAEQIADAVWRLAPGPRP
jgi:hypothetical protein